MARHTPLTGLLDPYEFPDRPDCVSGFVVQVDWIDLQPSASGSTAASIVDGNPIDLALEAIANYSNANSTRQARGRALILKIGLQRAVGTRKGSARDPQWLRDACGTVQMENPQNLGQGVFPVTKTWESTYWDAYDDFMVAMQARYDNSDGLNPKIGDLVMGGGAFIFAEPFLRHTTSSTNRTNLLNGGYTRTKDQNTLRAVINSMARFTETPVSVAYNRHQYVTDSGGAGTDMPFTLECMALHKTNLGPLAIIENNSYNYFPENEPPTGNGKINKDPQDLYGVPTGSPPRFSYASGIFSYRGDHSLITEQTEHAGRLDASNTNMDVLLTGAKNQGCSAIELPGDTFPYAIPGDTGAGAGTNGDARVAFLEPHNQAIKANWVSYGGSNAPTKPGKPAVSGTPTTTSATVTWAASTDADSDLSYYRVQVSTDGGSTYSAIGGNIAAGTTQYTHTFDASTSVRSHKYRVRAVDEAGNDSGWSTPSDAISIPATAAADTTPPTAPGSVTAVQRESAAGADITWGASSDTGSGVDHYAVYQERLAPTASAEVHVGDNGPSDLGVSVEGLQYEARYRWRVEAWDGADNKTSAYSNELTIMRTRFPDEPDLPPPITFAVYNPRTGVFEG